MLKHYTSLNECLERNGFNKNTSCIANDYLISEHTNKQTYLCHIISENNNWKIDKCKQYTKAEAIKEITNIILLKKKDEI